MKLTLKPVPCVTELIITAGCPPPTAVVVVLIAVATGTKVPVTPVISQPSFPRATDRMVGPK